MGSQVEKTDQNGLRQADNSRRILQGQLPERDDSTDNLLLCHEWDNTVRWQAGERLHHLFESRVDQLLQEGDCHLAVDGEAGQWTYQQLDERANQLARFLLLQGFRAGDVIGLLFDKSVHSYLSMLAVLKINAAYVPLDPAFPEDRIAYIVEDAGIKGILSLAVYTSLTKESHVPVICLDTVARQIDPLSGQRLDVTEAGQPVSELCYIIYTSGSTGRPKGVPIHQASICNFVRVAAEVYGYRQTDRVYQGLTIAFDFAVEEIWVPLVVGATLLPNATGSSLLGSDLAHFLQENKATAMCCVPTLLATIEEALPDLQLLIVSGEACPQDLVMRWAIPGRTILNAYGPTETTVTATVARLEPGKAVTIGKPLPTYSVMILEPGTEHVLPWGEEGEIAIAGVGVAQGYLKRDEQTKKAFINDFLALKNNPSGRIYRTGDLGVINADGDIEYRGRIDLQVKIRGYRIELAEIESVILGVEGVAQAVVDTFELQPGVKELVAYYTLKKDVGVLPQDTLTRFVRDVLPDYMVPSYYEQLDSLPLMTSDKVDRKALPQPSGKRMNAGGRVVAAQTATEAAVAQALAHLLALEQVSVEDDFFADLGVSSLLMARYCTAIRQRLPWADISMRDVYRYPNVRKLSAYLDTTSNSEMPDVKHTGHYSATWHTPSTMAYYLCGTLQLVSYLWFLFLAIEVALWAGAWIAEAGNPAAIYLRLASFLAASFFGWTGLAILAKWTIIGRWKQEKIPIWSLRYYRFWLLKQIVQINPMALFKGYPLYNVYLRLMGAHIGKNVVLECHVSAVCADLLSIGDNTICRNDALLVPYKAVSNRIYTGPVILGNNVIVGEGSVVDIHTRMEDNTQLGHASCLCEGQVVPQGKHYHGNPAEETTIDFASDVNAQNPLQVTALRRFIYSLGQLLNVFLGTVPLLITGLFVLAMSIAPEARLLTQEWLLHVLGISALVFVGVFFLSLFMNTVVAGILNRFLKVDRDYILYGVHFWLFKLLQRLGHSSSFTLLFGDSSYIVHYMKLVGYRLSQVIQTGSNFGLEHKHDNPYLCQFGSGTMISDGFFMLNLHESSHTFHLAHAMVGNDNFVGNNVYYPPNGKTGNNCLIATKAMVPIAGDIREDVGLLGSPCFEIPRTTGRDPSIAPASRSPHRLTGLKQKNRHNLMTILLFLASGFLYLFSTLLIIFGVVQAVELGAWERLGIVSVFLLFSIVYFIVLERAAFNFGRMQPITVSIYDKRYWQVERLWKFSESFLRKLWPGTPFRNIISRLLGIKLGKIVFDDGLYVSEKTLVEIGDYCNFNTNCVLQSHSLEEGIYKSDSIQVGDHCSIESKAFVHYGVKLGNGVVVKADSFVMKGEYLPDRSVWGGNPAKKYGVSH